MCLIKLVDYKHHLPLQVLRLLADETRVHFDVVRKREDLSVVTIERAHQLRDLEGIQCEETQVVVERV